MNVVIMDDEPEIVTILTVWLRLRGHFVCPVTSSLALRKELSERKCDVVLLDLVMPWANGLTLIEDIRTHSARTAVLVMSGITDPRLVVTACKEGADAYLGKPIDFEKLERALSSIEERRASSFRPQSRGKDEDREIKKNTAVAVDLCRFSFGCERTNGQ